VYVVLAIGALAMIAPYVVQVLTSLKTYDETVTIPPTLFPAVPQWQNYVDIASTSFPIFVQVGNSIIVTAVRVAGQLLLGSMAAYAFARLKFPFRRTLFAVFLSVLMVPSQLFLIPQYQFMQGFGWLDSLQALFLPGIFSAFGRVPAAAVLSQPADRARRSCSARWREPVADLLQGHASAGTPGPGGARIAHNGVELERSAVATDRELFT
jgi:ABC-type spermidine/putrescine transport system permease subunit II